MSHTADPVQPEALLALLATSPGFNPDNFPQWLVAEVMIALKDSGYADANTGTINLDAALSELNRIRIKPQHSIAESTNGPTNIRLQSQPNQASPNDTAAARGVTSTSPAAKPRKRRAARKVPRVRRGAGTLPPSITRS